MEVRFRRFSVKIRKVRVVSNLESLLSSPRFEEASRQCPHCCDLEADHCCSATRLVSCSATRLVRQLLSCWLVSWSAGQLVSWSAARLVSCSLLGRSDSCSTAGLATTLLRGVLCAASRTVRPTRLDLTGTIVFVTCVLLYCLRFLGLFLSL